MTPLINDRWQAEFPVTELGRYLFTIEGWVDHFETWSRQLAKRIQAGQDVAVELEVGARMIEEAATRATGNDGDASRLVDLARTMRSPSPLPAAASPSAFAEPLSLLSPDRAARSISRRSSTAAPDASAIGRRKCAVIWSGLSAGSLSACSTAF